MKKYTNKKNLLSISIIMFMSFTFLSPVKVYAALSWETVGSEGFSDGEAYYTSIAIDGSGTPYVVYEDEGNSYKATVKKYNESSNSWETVGSEGFSDGGVNYTSIAIDGSGTPYVVYDDGENSYKATVKKYNESSNSWETVGSEGFSDGEADYMSIAIDGSGTPYVVYRDYGNSSKATVKKYNESSNSWETVGNESCSDGYADNTSIAIDGSGTPYVVYRDYGNSYKATVKKYNESSNSWETVGIEGFSDGSTYDTSIAIDGSGTPYVVYEDGGNSSKATVKKYNESSNSWETVGIEGFSDDLTYDMSIAIDGSGTPYVVYEDYGNSLKATVKKYNESSNSWETVGIEGFSDGGANYTSIAIDGSGTLYVVYNDVVNSSKATVKKYEKEITNVSYIDDITVENGTDKNHIGLPEVVNITLSNATTTSVAVTWNNESPAYDGNTEGTYTFTGTLSLPSGVINPNNLKAIVDVIVGEPTITSVDSLPDINVANGTDVLGIGLPTSVEASLSNATTSAAVTWDNGSPDYDGNTANTYKFTGTLSLPSGVANPHDYKAVVNVIVKAALPVIPPENPIPPTPPVPIIPQVTEETTPAAVTIKGTERVGKTLEAELLTESKVRFTTSAGVTYEWYRLSDKDSNSSNAIGDDETYKLVSSDKGKYIQVIATYDGKTFEAVTGKIAKRSSSSSSSSSDDDDNNNDTNIINNVQPQNVVPVVQITNGWQKQSDNTWKYGENGQAVIGWKQINGIWYLFDSNGTMETGFKQEGDKTYYLENSGAMATDWELINGSWYLFDEHGVMIIDWAQVDGKWYYLNPNGAMATGWISLDGKWYYLYGDGSLAVSTTINGYTVDENGVWVI